MQTFTEVTRRIKPEAMAEIAARMEKIDRSNLEKISSSLVKPEHLLNQDSLIYQDDFPYIALLALREEVISVSEFAYLQTLWAIKEEIKPLRSKIKYIPLITNGYRNLTAVHYLNLMFKKSTLIPWLIQKSTEQQIQELYAAIIRFQSILEPIDQGFWLIPQAAYQAPLQDPNDKYYGFKKHTITQEIRAGTDTHPMCLPLGHNFMILSSSALFQIWLELNFDAAVKVNPVLGPSSVDDIRQGDLKRQRDIAIPFPGLELPKEADHFPAPSALDFILHDRYHCLRSSEISPRLTKAFVDIADNYQKLQDDLKKYLSQLKARQEKRKPLFQTFLDQISHFSPQQQQQAKIELGKKLKQEEKILNCLQQMQRFTGQLKFRLYDMEQIVHSNFFEFMLISNLEIHISMLRGLPQTATYLPSFIKVLVKHFFEATHFNQQQLGRINHSYRIANQNLPFVNLSAKEKPFVLGVIQYLHQHQRKKHLLMFGQILTASLILLVLATVLEISLVALNHRMNFKSVQPS